MVSTQIKRAKWEITATFPALDFHAFSIESPKTPNYNCIAYAAGDDTQRWDVSPFIKCYWPQGVPRIITLDTVEAAFASLGYTRASNADLCEGIEKIAIFEINGKPKHASRQLGNGKWVSKLGAGHDIEHNDLNSLCGDEYGTVYVIMQRERA